MNCVYLKVYFRVACFPSAFLSTVLDLFFPPVPSLLFRAQNAQCAGAPERSKETPHKTESADCLTLLSVFGSHLGITLFWLCFIQRRVLALSTCSSTMIVHLDGCKKLLCKEVLFCKKSMLL